MSAMMFTYKTTKFFHDDLKGDRIQSGLLRDNSIDQEKLSRDQTDISFENHIPEQFRPTQEEYGWMRETPWRGATAAHFLLLVQRLIYENQYGNAMKAGLHLRFAFIF